MEKDNLFNLIDWPARGNLDIFFLLCPEELIKRWIQIFGKADKQDRTIVLPSFKTVRKCLVHRDYKLYLMGLKELGELQEIYHLKPFLLERLYKQREKEIQEERKDKDHQAIRTGLRKILEAGKKSAKKESGE
ncbi:MAG: hypothetical protein ACFFDT_20065 [Candidatus Hodarchaeota archaeon]